LLGPEFTHVPSYRQCASLSKNVFEAACQLIQATDDLDSDPLAPGTSAQLQTNINEAAVENAVAYDCERPTHIVQPSTAAN
jgi:hypothetical protein